jgi:hypothetical protein
MTRAHLGMVFLLAACVPALAAAGVTTIANPGGGTIAYAQLPQQHTAQGAMGKVLQYVQSKLGARPDIDKVMKSPDGNSLAVTFTVGAAGASQTAGLALVAVSATGPGAGAVLSDKVEHLRTSLQPMLNRLQQEAVAKGGPAGAQAAIANAGGGQSSGSSAAKPPATPSSSPSGAGPVSSAPAAKLITTPIPGGMGTMGLPEGWRITAARSGDVSAQGPNGEVLRFGMAQSAIDPNNPQGRALGRGPGGTAPGTFIFMPVGTPGDAAFRSMLAQLAQKQRKPAPAIDYLSVKEISNAGQGKNWLLIGNIVNASGPAVTWVYLSMGSQVIAGSWMMTVNEISVPQALANKEAATIGPIFGAFNVNAQVAGAQVRADGQVIAHAFANTMTFGRQTLDASARSTQATSNYLRDQTVVSDSALNAHGTVPDDVANALIAANPNRFQAVSSGSYVKGIDY